MPPLIDFQDRSNAFGGEATASGRYSNALGLQAIASSEGANALGMNALASGKNANAIGTGATASAENAFALGVDSVADEANTVSVGRAAKAATDTEAEVTGITRRIVNVAAGTKATDAATVGQLQTVSKKAGEQYLNLDSTTDGTTGITNKELSINASDVIDSSTTALATVKAVYDEVRPTADGTYVKTSKTTRENLAALDKQVSGNSTLLGYLSVNATDGALTTAPSTSAKATGSHSLALGELATASGSSAAALGRSATASGPLSIAIGNSAMASAKNSTALGAGAMASELGSIAIGDDATVSGMNSSAIGVSATVSKDFSTAIGTNANASGRSANVVGSFAEASGRASSVFGDHAKATVDQATALGAYAKATGVNSVALGQGSEADADNVVSVGTSTQGRRIVNVAEGSRATDVATVSQTATIESASQKFLTVDEAADKNTNGSKRLQLTLKTGDLADDASEALVTNTTVKNALQDYAKADASNITSGSANQAAWLSALGTESVASGSKMLITSGAVYKEVRVESNGNYVKSANTAAENLVALDDRAKKNADAASKAQTTAESAVDKAKKAQSTAETAQAAAKKAQTTAETAKAAADKAQSTAETAKTAADKAQSTAETAKAAADKAQTTAETAKAAADKAQATAEKAEAKADKAQATAEKAEAKADKAQAAAEKADAKAEKAQTTAEQAKDAAKKAQSTAEKVDEKAAKAQTTAEKAQTRANDAMAEARKHTKVTASGGLQVTRTDGENGATYDVSIAEDADFTAKQTTWKDGDAFSTANSSGFFSGGSSVENADAYISKGVVSAGTDAEKKIVLDGNTGKATFGKTVTIDGTSGKISGVAAGEVSETSTDAVNGSQLYEVQQGVAQNAEGLEFLGRAVNKVDRKIDRTGALAAALAGLHPQDYDEDHPVSGAVGIGHYKGKQALAVGMFVRPVENFMVSLGASGSSDDYMLNAGASFRFGGPTLKKSPQQMMAKLSDQEVTIRDLSAQNQAQKTRLESQDEKLAQQASEIKSQKVALDAQNAKIDAQKAQIESQSAKLESQDARLERQAAEIEQLKVMMAKIQAKLGK